VTFDFLLGMVQKHILKINLKKIGMLFLFLVAIGTSVILWVRSNDVKKFRAGLPTGFLSRQDGFQGLKNLYNLDLDVVEMQPGLMYDAIKNEDVDIVAGFSTDGRIEAFDLVILEDDKKYFPPYYAAPVVRNQTLKKFPELENALEMLAGMLNNETMAALNYQADNAHDDPRNVAASFLLSKGFETGRYSTGNNPDIIVGSKDFTESYILAEMFKIIIENNTNLTVDLKLSFGGTKLVFDALNNANIDLYPEYSGTGLLVLLPEEDKKTNIIYESDVVYDYVKQKFSQHYNLKWLSPLGFNNTHAILMRRKQAELLNIETISDLSRLSQKQ
jgi:osmoprotectant transport system permease protein